MLHVQHALENNFVLSSAKLQSQITTFSFLTATVNFQFSVFTSMYSAKIVYFERNEVIAK